MITFLRPRTLTLPGELSSSPKTAPAVPRKAPPGVKLPVSPEPKKLDLGRPASIDIGRPYIGDVGRPVYPGIGKPATAPAHDAPVHTLIGLRALQK